MGRIQAPLTDPPFLGLPRQCRRRLVGLPRSVYASFTRMRIGRISTKHASLRRHDGVRRALEEPIRTRWRRPTLYCYGIDPDVSVYLNQTFRRFNFQMTNQHKRHDRRAPVADRMDLHDLLDSLLGGGVGLRLVQTARASGSWGITSSMA